MYESGVYTMNIGILICMDGYYTGWVLLVVLLFNNVSCVQWIYNCEDSWSLD